MTSIVIMQFKNSLAGLSFPHRNTLYLPKLSPYKLFVKKKLQLNRPFSDSWMLIFLIFPRLDSTKRERQNNPTKHFVDHLATILEDLNLNLNAFKVKMQANFYSLLRTLYQNCDCKIFLFSYKLSSKDFCNVPCI